ncbi:sulfatase-like hydrolase/transferase [Flavobacterium sp. DGU11]|uniref:Sulfatase-like hydrolase/transferase n=1 Tax=Flavobacterium arundinis TaxID=3139143 RepID=A0ABU9HVH8_9FLAO
MFEKLRNRFKIFLDSPKDVPLLAGFISGFYPFLFFYSNNYPSVNTWQHTGFFFLLYVVPAVFITVVCYIIFGVIDKLKTYRKHLLFVLPVIITSALLSYIMYFTFKKKILLCLLIIMCLLSLKLHNHYKRILVLILVMALFPVFRIAIHIYQDTMPMQWVKQEDDILNIKFRHKPNIYMIQPDGYASEQIMEKPPYSYQNDFYGWLEGSGFKVYDGFRSNYPASLTSNASIFAMKHHYFDYLLFPSIEMPNAREAIMDNNAVKVLKGNGYASFFLAEDEYLRQNRTKGNYDYYNFEREDIPLYTKGDKLVREVYYDLEKVVKNKTGNPKFVFVEKVLPHHIHFDGTGKKAERDEYIAKIRQANGWLKKTIATIEANDSNAVIIILADHGGWVGMENYNEFCSTKDESLVRSTFGTLAAIKWNGLEHSEYDKKLKTNVNVFRVLFSCLAENTSYLNHLEKDTSYNIRYESFMDGVYELIDQNGKVVREKQ